MRDKSLLSFLGTLLWLAAAGAGISSASTLVDPGFDLFQALTGTTFGGVPFQGVPIGNFNFGGTIGTKNTGNTALIEHRVGAATAPSTAISTELIALQLMSSSPADFGLGVGFYFMTLQSARGGPASTGRMTINFGAEPPTGAPHGTFDSFFDVFFDIRFGSLNGPIALSNTLTLTEQGVLWTHVPTGKLEIPGANTFLNGTDRAADFFPLGDFQESFPTGAIIRIRTTDAAVPEPGTLLLLGGGLALLGLRGAGFRNRQS